MSTSFKKIEGSTERVDANIILTSFFGGVEKGRSLQITINAEHESGHVQLTKDQAIELRKGLDEWLSGNPLTEITR